MKHELKIYPQYYERVADGTKNFEVRDNIGRDFQVGDIVVFHEWDPEKIAPTDSAPRGYTGSPTLEFRIGYVYSLEKDRVVFSLLPINQAKKTNSKSKS